MEHSSIDAAEVDAVDYEYIKSRGAHGVHAHHLFDAFVGSEREIWFGSDGSGLIRESSGPASFFTDDGHARWQAAGSPTLTHAKSIDLYAPGCLPGPCAWRARVNDHPDGLEAGLKARSPLSLRTVQELLGEAVVEPEFCQAVYEMARRLPGVEMLGAISDQLGRAGYGLTRVENGHRVELIFSSDTSCLLAYQNFLNDSVPFAPAGTLHSWSAFLTRRIAPSLPADVPPVPQLPCVAPGAGRGFTICPGFVIGTGYVEDPLPQLAMMHAQGVLTDAEYESAKANTLRRD